MNNFRRLTVALLALLCGFLLTTLSYAVIAGIANKLGIQSLAWASLIFIFSILCFGLLVHQTETISDAFSKSFQLGTIGLLAIAVAVGLFALRQQRRNMPRVSPESLINGFYSGLWEVWPIYLALTAISLSGWLYHKRRAQPGAQVDAGHGGPRGLS